MDSSFKGKKFPRSGVVAEDAGGGAKTPGMRFSPAQDSGGRAGGTGGPHYHTIFEENLC